MMSRKGSSPLTIAKDASGAIAVTGAVGPGDEAILEEAMEAARKADGDVVMILTHELSGTEREDAPGGSPAAGAASLSAIAHAVARALDQRESMLSLIEHLSPPMEVASSAAVLQARRNSEARQALFDEFGGLKAVDVADLAGSSAQNRSALAARWRKEGRLLAISHQGTRYYPGFQFGEDGRPLPAMAEILALLRPAGMSEWELALWFTTRTGWLDDRRPVDLLRTDPALVCEAAKREVGAVAG